MGNFFFPSETLASHKAWRYGYLSELCLSEDEVKLEIYPYKFVFDKVIMLVGEEKEHFWKYMDCLCRPIANEEVLRHLFDSWCLTQDYIERLSLYKKEYFADGCMKEVKTLKNILNCEAHNELVKNSLMMIFESRVEESKLRVVIIRKLQNMKIIEM